jgi:hypothetical protein
VLDALLVDMQPAISLVVYGDEHRKPSPTAEAKVSRRQKKAFLDLSPLSYADVAAQEMQYAREHEREWRERLDAFGTAMEQQRENTLDIMCALTHPQPFTSLGRTSRGNRVDDTGVSPSSRRAGR